MSNITYATKIDFDRLNNKFLIEFLKKNDCLYKEYFEGESPSGNGTDLQNQQTEGSSPSSPAIRRTVNLRK